MFTSLFCHAQRTQRQDTRGFPAQISQKFEQLMRGGILTLIRINVKTQLLKIRRKQLKLMINVT